MTLKTKGKNKTKVINTAGTNIIFHYKSYLFKIEYIKDFILHIEIFGIKFIDYNFNTENLPF